MVLDLSLFLFFLIFGGLSDVITAIWISLSNNQAWIIAGIWKQQDFCQSAFHTTALGISCYGIFPGSSLASTFLSISYFLKSSPHLLKQALAFLSADCP